MYLVIKLIVHSTTLDYVRLEAATSGKSGHWLHLLSAETLCIAVASALVFQFALHILIQRGNATIFES